MLRQLTGLSIAASAATFIVMIASARAAAAQSVYPLSALGTGSGFDDKNTGDCPAPSLSCPAPDGTTADWCSCVQGSGSLRATLAGLNLSRAKLTEQIVIDWVNFDSTTGQILTLYGRPTGAGGFCYAANGIATLSSVRGTLSMIMQGESCDGVVVGTANPMTLNGAYMIVGGTGSFSNATGTGTFASSLADVNANNAQVSFQLQGSVIQ